MDFEEETTNYTASARKTPDTSIVRKSGGNSPSVDDLKKLETNLKAELETALSASEIDADAIVEIREKLSRLPLKISAANITELKTRLETIESEFMTCEDKLKLIRAVQLQRKIELQEKQKELEPYWHKYNRCAEEMSFVQNDIALLRMERREKRALLFSLSEQIKN